jgi:hypothetical protein
MSRQYIGQVRTWEPGRLTAAFRIVGFNRGVYEVKYLVEGHYGNWSFDVILTESVPLTKLEELLLGIL